MNNPKQIFQTDNKWRWRSFKWTSRFFIAAILLMIPIVIITLSMGLAPTMPVLSDASDKLLSLKHPVTPLN